MSPHHPGSLEKILPRSTRAHKWATGFSGGRCPKSSSTLRKKSTPTRVGWMETSWRDDAYWWWFYATVGFLLEKANKNLRNPENYHLMVAFMFSFISRFHSIFISSTVSVWWNFLHQPPPPWPPPQTSQPSGQPPGGHRSGLPALPNNMDLKKSWRRGPGDDDDDGSLAVLLKAALFLLRKEGREKYAMIITDKNGNRNDAVLICINIDWKKIEPPVSESYIESCGKKNATTSANLRAFAEERWP